MQLYRWWIWFAYVETTVGEACTQKSRKRGLRSFFCRIQCDNESFDPGDVLSFFPYPSPPFPFFIHKWVSDAHLFLYIKRVHSTLYSAFIRHRHCFLFSNGEGVFMNVHKHIPCQVSVLCMLSKHFGVLIVFSECWCHKMRKQQAEIWPQSLIQVIEESNGCGGSHVHAYVFFTVC